MKKTTCYPKLQRRIILLLLLMVCFAVENLSAQVPGYRGKRFSAGYNASAFFYFANLYGTDGNLFASTRISYKTELYANYALTRKASIGFSYYHAKQKTYLNSEESSYYYIRPQDEFIYNAINIFEVSFKFFKNDFIAPVGLYYQPSFGVVKFKMDNNGMPLYIWYLGNNNSSYGTASKKATPYTCFKLGFHIGKTNPIGTNFYINTAVGVNVFVGGDFERVYLNASPWTEENYILKNLSRELMTRNTLEIKLGLGWLAF